MRQAGETGNSLKMVFRNHPENERIVRKQGQGEPVAMLAQGVC